MNKVNDNNLKMKYINEYRLNEIFTEDMTEYMELMVFEKNEYLCKENEKIEYLYFFVKGKAKVYVSLKNGKSLLICFYYPLMVLGDLELVNFEEATTNIQVIEESYCIALSFNKVRDKLLEDAKFLRYACESIADKLRRSSNNNSINLLYPLENRLASYILVTEEQDNNSEGNILKFNGNLTEIAELLGTSYRHLLRTLNTLIQKGAIKKVKSYYEIINENILEQLSADLYK
jgi:CRP-like cAMP-binding protein